jgi:two-component system sensor histidine kinase KdpD
MQKSANCRYFGSVTIASVKRTISSFVAYAASAAGVAATTLIFYRLIRVNPTTVALTFLLGVLCVSALWGLAPAVFMAVTSTLAFNYFFLPPVRTFTISDPQNWVALAAFLVTAVVASQLSDRARREATQANDRRREVERLYGFSQQLLSSDNLPELLNSIPRYVVDYFGVRAVAILLPDKPDIYRSGHDTQGLDPHDLQLVNLRGEPRIDLENHRAFLPLRMGVRVVGSLGVAGNPLPSRQSLDALSGLIAIAVERAGAIEKLGRAEAARQSDQLRSTLLDSVAHEFRTPLTSIKASVTSLLANPRLDSSQQRELLTVVNEESDRLNRLVGEAAEMAQWDSGKVRLNLQQNPVQLAIDAAIEESRQILAMHPIELNIPPDLPVIQYDQRRIQEVLTQLLENAAKYSARATKIQISAELKDRAIVVSVADHGPGIDDFEQGLIFDKFYRGQNQRVRVQGTGMGLAIAKAIIEAHGGKIGVTSQLGNGSVFYFSLPCP